MKFRSKFESEVARLLINNNINFEFEPHKIPFQPPKRVYIPDFFINDKNLYIEVKGRLDKNDRVKHLLVKEQNPEVDVRFFFSNSRQKIYKGSKTSYGDWCDRHGLLWADKILPKEWIK